MSKSPKSPQSDQKTPSSPYKPDPKGVALMQEAQKVLSKSGFSQLFSSSNKYEDARDILHKAAAQFKISKNFLEAGEAHSKAAEIAEKQLKEGFEAATDWINAAKAYKNADTSLAIQCYQYGINIHMESGKMSSAARLWKELAELHERELATAAAMHAYGKAADCYEAEDQRANATSCLVKVAEMSAEQGEYARAIQIYEKVSQNSLDNTGMRWSVKDYLFKALLCHFVLAARSAKQDLAPVEEAVEKYRDMLPQLDGTRELKLIQDAVEAFKSDDEDAFTDVVFKYDEIYKLDNWTAKILLDVKKALMDGPAAKNLDFTGADNVQKDANDFT